MEYNRKAFGIVTGRIRTEKGMTQEELSRAAGISRSHLAMLENGRKTVRLDTLWHLAEALGTAPDALIREVMTECRRL